MLPPAIDGLGTTSGFALRLEDRAGRGAAALAAAQAQLLAAAAKSPVLSGVYQEGLPAGSRLALAIDRQKAQVLGVGFPAIAETLSAAMGSAYVNDFPNLGRMQQVIVQAEATARMSLDDVLRLRVRNAAGGSVPCPSSSPRPGSRARFSLSAITAISGADHRLRRPGPLQRRSHARNGTIGEGTAGRLCYRMDRQSLEEQQAGAQAPLMLGLSMLVVFLVLAALYESWSVPVSVLLTIPLGLVGAVAAVMLRDLPNDVFFKVGLVTIIGLSAKNAILIVEFARSGRGRGLSAAAAAVEAARLRLRPIVMTSLAFALGIVPLMIASGAGKRRSSLSGRVCSAA